MANAPTAQNKPIPEEQKTQSEPCVPDCDLPENSPENLDARLDHAIEETFPTSDPISVTVTKQPVGEVTREAASTTPDSHGHEAQDQAEQETTETLLDVVRESLQDVRRTTSGTVREAYTESQRYIRQARERYPEAEQYYREGRQAVHRGIMENPWLSLLAAGAVGYLLAWMIHSEHRARDRRVPDHARTRSDYAGYRSDEK